MAKPILLSEEDARIIQRLLDIERQRVGRPLQAGPTPPNETSYVHSVLKVPDDGIPPLTLDDDNGTGDAYDDVGTGYGSLYSVYEDADECTLQPIGMGEQVYNVGCGRLSPTLSKYVLAHKNGFGTWLVEARADLVELCLNENHPGRGVAFDANLGTWKTSDNSWDYTTKTAVKAIDWRYGVPYPNAGARGLFVPRFSDTYGTIYECVSLDCDTVGTDCCGTG